MSTQINSINSFYPTEKPKELNTKLDNIDNRIIDNNRQIVLLENQITAQKEVSSITREMITNNTNRINTIKEIINNNEKLIGVHKEHRGLLQESRDLTKESRDLTQQMIDCVEKMLAIMTKNLAKYSNMDKNRFQQLPEVIETKKNLTETVSIKLNQYPKEEHKSLMDTAKKVIDNSFYAINTDDLSFNKKVFLNLENNIDTALAKLYTSMKGDYTILPFKNYRIMQNIFYNFSNLSIENFKI